MFPGGIADKFGNEYERKWAVRNLLNVLAGTATAVRYEGISPEFTGFEFELRRPACSEWHQTKASAPHGNWTVNALGNEGVLAAMKARLSADSTTECVFVSQDPSKPMRELCGKARIANDGQELLGAVSENNRQDFARLQDKYWGVDTYTVFHWLRRCQFRCESIQSVDEAITDHGRHLLLGDTSLYESLSNYLIDNFNKLITIEVARSWILAESPFSFRPAALDQTLAEAAHEANTRYLQSYTPFGFGGERIQRQVTSEVLSALQTNDAPRLVLLTGSAGSGKSGVVRDVMVTLDAHQVPHLTFRIDRYLNAQSKSQIGSVLLDREDSPVSALANLAQDGPGILIVDQIDAVSETSGRTGAIKDTLFALVREAQRYADIRCLLVCRTFDFENDPQYRHLKKEHQATIIDVPRLSLGERSSSHA